MEIDIGRRRAVMRRSRKLGHCICNPQEACPCPAFIEVNVCPCAGEQIPVKVGATALTRHVRKAGCASKIGQAELLQILGNLPVVEHPAVVIGAAAGDDAGVYRLDEDRLLVQTVDVFTPCVDDPYLFGQIAAANSVSDVYAMGGTPLTALSIIAFPIDELSGSVMEAILTGGIEKLREADCPVIGGHSIQDTEVKCGFAVTGLIRGGAPVRRDAARPGDALVLTKPLGTGMVSFAAQLGLVNAEIQAELGGWMATLNRDAAELMVRLDAHACTDVTGFGLAGHLLPLVRAADVDVEIDLARLPVFGMVPECLAKDVYGGAVDRNQVYAMPAVAAAPASEPLLPILFDPQTSGGLLIALPEERARVLVAELHARGHAAAAVIGRVRAAAHGAGNGRIVVRGAALENLVGTRAALDLTQVQKPRPAAAPAPRGPATAAPGCCEHPPAIDEPRAAAQPAPAAASAPVANSQREHAMTSNNLDLFREFMAAANRPGLIDARGKKLMAVALAIAHHCRPCLEAHLAGAFEMGITEAELDEAADLAIVFGGCTAMMFYREQLAEAKARRP